MTLKQIRAYAQNPDEWVCINAIADGFVREYQLQYMDSYFLKIMVKENTIDLDTWLESEVLVWIEEWRQQGLYQMVLNPDMSIRELRPINEDILYEIMLNETVKQGWKQALIQEEPGWERSEE